MRLFFLSALIGVRLLAQGPDASSRVTLVLSAPAAVGDRIEILGSSGRTGFTLVTPEGRRITAANAASEGFGWYERGLNQADWGKSVIIPFQRPAAGGAYVIEVSTPATPGSHVSVSLERVSSPTYASPRFPGAAVFAFPMRAPGTITLAVKEDHGLSLIDILVSDPTTGVALTLPDGRRITAESASLEGLEWRTTTDPFTAPAQVVGLLFPHPGRHHLIYFQAAQQGNYQIRAIDPAARGEFRALFLPYDQSSQDRPGGPPAPLPQEVQPACRVSLLSARVSGRPNREGRVVVSAQIDAQGNAHDVKVIQSAGSDLDRDAIEYVEHCAKHNPGQGLVRLELNFRAI